ncbi:hypothetical protein P170DRAFT_206377 [Aspergillus steynii IBT 23096]|uniref:Uncharacterized protein n=1 Tax=Aspergillus steynii IBT 23096 TaxID=1392250 RepID=A0A2I2G5G3_9EURO|nr:uncharacterized protein P170DRAFT_206377 [Aspergillus steynii IBT 23096]PLB48119.1 hypothetical protein P170DRAFT_206377 [Aspergillus steynii IBT 23096]
MIETPGMGFGLRKQIPLHFGRCWEPCTPPWPAGPIRAPLAMDPSAVQRSRPRMKAGMTSRITIPDPRSLWGARLLILVWPGMALLFAFFAALSGLFCYPELAFHGPYFAEVPFPGSMRLGIVLQRPCTSGTLHEDKETGEAREDEDFPRITPPSRRVLQE